ncbi:MAG: hypothetical protein AB7E72_12650 [Lysobacterales bacterium]
MNTRICTVLRADDDVDARAKLAEHLHGADQVVLVVFASDRLPTEPWPELAHERVRVAFAPPRRRLNPEPGSISIIETQSTRAGQPRKQMTGAAHA